MSKRQTRSATRALYGDWQNTVLFVLKLVVLNKYVEIAEPCVSLCRETWALPSGLSDEDAILMRKDNAFWPHIINKKYHRDYTRLHWAASKCYTNRVVELVKWGANIDSWSDDGTPLSIALESSARWSLCSSTFYELLKLGANPNIHKRYGWSPLFKASDYGWEEIVRALLFAGADTEATNLYGDFPLYVAMYYLHYETAKALVEAGADKERVHCNGKTLRDVAKRGSISNQEKMLALLE